MRYLCLIWLQLQQYFGMAYNRKFYYTSQQLRSVQLLVNNLHYIQSLLCCVIYTFSVTFVINDWNPYF